MGISQIAIGVMVFVMAAQLALAIVNFLFGTAADRRRGWRHLGMAGTLALLLLLLSLMPACTPVSGAAPTVEPDTVRSLPAPAWAAYPVGQWLNMDWDLWSCPRAKGC